jgi:hypothetical protein
MSNNTYTLEIYDDEDYAGPNPVHLIGQFVVRGPEGTQYYVLKPSTPLMLDGRELSCLAIRPHYDGDPINNAIESNCTVGIALPANGTGYKEGVTYGFNDFVFWKVGKIKPPH